MKSVALSEWIAQLESGSRPKGGVKDGSGQIPSVGAEHLSESGGFNFNKLRLIPETFFRSLKQGRIQQYDILVVKDGATTGKVSYVDDTFPFHEAAINEHVFRLGIDRTKADPGFVFRFLQSPGGQAGILKDFRGATVGGIGRTFIDKIFVPDVPVPEQHRIATILDKADGIGRKRRQAFAEGNALLRAAFLDAFGDLIKNPHGFEVKPLAELVNPHRPITYGILMPGPDIPDGVPYVRVVDIQEGRVLVSQVRRTTPAIAKQYRRSELRPWDLLLSIRGHVGRLAFVPDSLDGANITQDTARLSVLSKVDAIYLRACLESKGFQHLMAQRTKGGAVKGINLTDIKILPIPLAPEKLRERFADLYLRAQSTFEKERSSLAAAGDLFASLSQRAFRGEI